MKQLINNMLSPGTYPTHVNIALLILRVVVGIFMLTHGIGKFQSLFGSEPIQFFDPLGIGPTPSLALAVFAEVFCAILLIFGLATRLAAIPLLTTMLVAGIIVHANDPFSAKELPLTFGLIHLTIAIIGAGRYSIDQLLMKNRTP